MGASCGGDDRFGAGRDELLLRDARELVEPAEVVGQGSDVALLQRADVRVGGRSVRGPTALGKLVCERGPPPLEEAEPGDGFEEAAERDLHVEGAVVGGVSVDEELAQAGLALVGDAVDLAVPFLVAAAGLRLARRRFALVTQGRQLTADSAGHRADGPGPGVINRADGAGQLEPVGRWGGGGNRDAAAPASELGNLLFQFIAVRLVLFEDPEDRHLDHEVRVSIRYIEQQLSSFRRCPFGVHLRYLFGVPLACGGPAFLFPGSVAAACPEGGGRAWAGARQWEGISSGDASGAGAR